MLKQFEAYIHLDSSLKKSELFLAISGGVDSMVLSYLLSHFNIKHTLLHCNFQLRDQESNLDEAFVINYAKSNQIDIKTIKFNTEDYATEHKLTTQEAARNLRYDWFNTFLINDTCKLLTAHHLDDSIETFLINLLRGTGLKGLTGIPSGKNNKLRPLLNFTKSDILEFAKQHNIKYREDSSNNTDNYLRNNLRHNLIPELKELTSNFEGKMRILFKDLSASEQYIEQTLTPLKNELSTNQKINIESIINVPKPLWYKIFKAFGLTRKNNTELIKLINGNTGAILNTKSYRILKNRNEIIVSEFTPKNELNYQINTTDETIELTTSKLRISKVDNSKNINFNTNSAYIDFNKLTFPLQIRLWQQGDKIQPLGMQGSKLISDVLTDKKINQFDKENQYVITSNQKIIWLVDLMVSNAFAIDDHTKSIIKIEHIQY